MTQEFTHKLSKTTEEIDNMTSEECGVWLYSRIEYAANSEVLQEQRKNGTLEYFH